MNKENMNEQCGKQSIKFINPPVIISRASVVGEMEGKGPLASYFDEIENDATFGQDSWEKGESEMVRRAVELAISKSGIDFSSTFLSHMSSIRCF